MSYDRRQVLYNILIEFHVTTKVVRLIKMCLNETCSKVCLGKNAMHFLLRIKLNKEVQFYGP